MAIRIQGVPMSPNKHVWVALTSIQGIGKSRALKLCEKTGIDSSTKISALTDQQAHDLTEASAQYQTEGDLRRKVASDIKRLTDAGSYRGKRHRAKLPCRGQRTKTNARTRKGRAKKVNN